MTNGIARARHLLAMVLFTAAFSACGHEAGPGPDPGGGDPVLSTGETARLTVLAGSPAKEINDAMFGTTGGPRFDAAAGSSATRAGFRLMQVPVGMERPLDSAALSQLADSYKAVVQSGMIPIVAIFPPSSAGDLSGLQAKLEQVLQTLEQQGKPKQLIFRIGNEPDNPGFWRDEQQDFFEIYAALAKEVQAWDPSVVIGGPGLVESCRSVRKFDCDDYSQWATGFLDYMQQKGAPVDFFSVHAYSPLVAPQFNEQFRKTATLLKGYPSLSPHYGAPLLGNDEWNLITGDVWTGKYHEELDSIWCGAHNVLAWGAMLEAGSELSLRYGGTGVAGAGDHDFLLLTSDGKEKPSYHALSAVNLLAGSRTLPVTGNNWITIGAIAGLRGDTVTVVLSAMDVERYMSEYFDAKTDAVYQEYLSRYEKPTPFSRFALTIKELPWAEGTVLTYDRRVLSESGLDTVEERSLTAGKTLELNGELDPATVTVITIRKK